MPYASDAQRKYFNANRDKMEAQGVDVDEWNQASKGMALPERVKNQATPRGRKIHEGVANYLANRPRKTS